MKTYVLTMSKVFPSYHPKKGQPTNFYSKFVDEIKLHTIRGNYALWKKRIDDINAGLAMLSVREWSTKPYCSPQVELFCLFKGEVGIQQLTTLKVNSNGKYNGIIAQVWDKNREFNKTIIYSDLVKNDGLELQDFYDWFNKPLVDPCIIHFSDLRY